MIALFKEHKKIIYCFLVLTFLFYGNSLRNKYALDDDYVTVTNFPIKGQPYVPNHTLVSKGFKGIGKIWKSRYAHDGEASLNTDQLPQLLLQLNMEFLVKAHLQVT